MLDDLRRENKILREKLKLLRFETIKSLEDQTASYRTSSPTTERLKLSFEEQGDIPEEIPMLSNRAKVVRGEASKRINVLLQDWREYKEKTEGELRKRQRSEQNIKELLQKKERENEELSYEISSYRALAMEQKNTIEILLEEKGAAEKFKERCAELERELSKQKRNVSELSCELTAKNDVNRQNNAEKEALLSMNANLRALNSDQRKKLELCEKDVSETSHELEMLEEMVKALNEPKLTFATNGTQNFQNSLPRPTKFDDSSIMPSAISPFAPGQSNTSTPNPRTARPHLNPTARNESSTLRSRIVPRSIDTNSTHPPAGKSISSSTDSSTGDSSKSTDNSFNSKKSALSALKSLQQDHDKKCDFLAEHIRKLKEENKEKEERLRKLETPSPKT